MTTYIGDIHGWSDRLERLLEQLSGPLLFVGDLIDRGPDSKGVIRRVRALCESGRATCLMGNHEFALVRALGVSDLHIPGDPDLFEAWLMVYGGDSVCESYGVRIGDADGLRKALGDDLRWMAQLPWVDIRRCGQQTVIASHNGLSAASWQSQVAELRSPDAWFQPESSLPPCLYQRRNHLIPCDLPDDYWVINGHQPVDQVVIQSQHICIDTTGGKPGRMLKCCSYARTLCVVLSACLNA